MPITTVTVFENHATVPIGEVIRTDPANFELVGPNQVVTIVVSIGNPDFPVPALVGEPVTDVLALLSAAQMVKGVVSYAVVAPESLYLITEQAPDFGVEAGAGTPVNYTVGVLGEVVRGHGRARRR